MNENFDRSWQDKKCQRVSNEKNFEQGEWAMMKVKDPIENIKI